MALSDTQIERFSRQIILPQVGGRGQERLLQSSVALAGDHALREIVGLSLAGAGIGRIILHGDRRLLDELVDVNPEIRVEQASGALGSVVADVLVACDAALADVDRAGVARQPLVAGGLAADGGWLVVSDHPDACASCVVRQVTASGVPEPVPALRTNAGVIGSLMALAVMKLRLGLGGANAPTWLQFDRSELMLTAHPVTPAPDCPVCQRQPP